MIDWRKHLAVILSNPSRNPELDKTSIVAMGDSLGKWYNRRDRKKNRGQIVASSPQLFHSSIKKKYFQYNVAAG